jgi:hypothetical protein
MSHNCLGGTILFWLNDTSLFALLSIGTLLKTKWFFVVASLLPAKKSLS